MATQTSCVIEAKKIWNHTGHQVTAGRTYRVDVAVRDPLKDWEVASEGLRGVPDHTRTQLQLLCAPLKRRPLLPYLVLILTVEKSHPMMLMENTPYTAPATGEILCYFNDVIFAYWNNHGSAQLVFHEL